MNGRLSRDVLKDYPISDLQELLARFGEISGDEARGIRPGAGGFQWRPRPAGYRSPLPLELLARRQGLATGNPLSPVGQMGLVSRPAVSQLLGRRAPAPRMDYHSPARMAQRAGASYMSAPVLPFGGSAAVARYNDPMSPGADAWHRDRMNDGTAHSWEQAASRVATKARTGQDFAKATGQSYPAMLGRDAGILPVRQDRADRLVNRALMG